MPAFAYSGRLDVHGEYPFGCGRAPHGWKCTRAHGHDGPCAAIPVTPAPEPRAWVAGDPDVPAALMSMAGGHGRLLWHKSRLWASANFSGSRDEIALEFFGAEASERGEAMLSVLADAEFVVPGRTVADVDLRYHTRLYRPQRRTVAIIEILLVEE